MLGLTISPSLLILGWSEGRNLRLDVRWGSAADPARNRKNAAELLALAPDVILATTTPSASALQEATRTVPIVFAMAADPVGSGVVDGLARPGGMEAWHSVLFDRYVGLCAGVRPVRAARGS